MKFSLIINYILNHLFSENSGTVAYQRKVDDGTNQEQEQSLPDRPIQRLDWRVALLKAIFNLFSELFQLFRRLFQSGYVESRKYLSITKITHEGKVAVISSGDSGIGYVVAAKLMENGFKVIIGLKDESTVPVFREADENKIRVLKLNLSSLESVREFAQQVSKSEPKIDLLVNSSDVYESQHVISRDGFEKNFQENYLSHFLLTNLLIPNLKKSENGRVVNLSAFSQYFGHINFDDINNLKITIPFRAYSQSKLANVLFTRELAKRLIDTDINVYVVSPEIIKISKQQLENSPFGELLSRITDPVNGSQTVFYVSLDSSVKNESGFYYSNLGKVEQLFNNATDNVSAEKLWSLSERWVKLNEEQLNNDVNEVPVVEEIPLE